MNSTESIDVTVKVVSTQNNIDNEIEIDQVEVFEGEITEKSKCIYHLIGMFSDEAVEQIEQIAIDKAQERMTEILKEAV